MNFWDKVFEAPAAPQQRQQPISPPATMAGQHRAWWQDQETVQSMVQSQAPVYQESSSGLSEAQIKAIRKRGHQNITSEEAQAIAEYDLTHKDRYLHECPQCGSGNFIPAGMRMGTVVMPTDKCFNCGAGARSPEPALGSGSGKGASIATRQIDTGGGGGNMFGVLSGIPRSYAPRP